MKIAAINLRVTGCSRCWHSAVHAGQNAAAFNRDHHGADVVGGVGEHQRSALSLTKRTSSREGVPLDLVHPMLSIHAQFQLQAPHEGYRQQPLYWPCCGKLYICLMVGCSVCSPCAYSSVVKSSRSAIKMWPLAISGGTRCKTKTEIYKTNVKY